MAGTRSAAGVADDSISAVLAQLYECNREIEARLIPRIRNKSRLDALHICLERVKHTLRLSAPVNEAFFRGLTADEIALVLQISDRTAKCELSMAKTWLRRQLFGEL